MKHRVKSHEEWLELRKGVITATEASTLLGLNPWSSPNKMWKEKHNSTFVGNSYTYIGQLLEPIVIELVNYILESNFALLETNKGKLFYIDKQLKLGATPDAMEGDYFLECKTTKPANYEKYKTSPPLYYIMQLIVQMICGKKEEGYLAIMSTDLSQESPELELPIAIFKVKKCKRLCALLEQELARFWETQKKGTGFRVDSKVKSHAIILVRLACGRIV